MKQIRFTVKIRLLCFVLGPASLMMGLFFLISGSNLFNVLANIFGIIGLAIMLFLNFGKFEKEDESATKNYGNACSVLLEILLALGCLSALISLFTNKPLVLTPQLFAIIAGASLIVLGLLFELYEHRSDL